jgi:hypothetical protein
MQDVLQIISGLGFVADATNVSDKFLLWLCILIVNKTLNHYQLSHRRIERKT